MSVTVFSPAKLNLFLAITGRREDGFHDLVSLAAPVEFGDELLVQKRDRGAGFTLECDEPGIPVDGRNLVLRAANAFAARTGWDGGARFVLTKRIPSGAGLGGGSSNAVAALRALNVLSRAAATEGQLAEVASGLGSDCALFLASAPVVMRGRGDRIEFLPVAAAQRIRGRRVVLFKPSFSIPTPWAYARMVARGTDYLASATAEKRVQDWQEGAAPLEEALFNNMEPAAFEKFPALPLMIEQLRRDFGVAAGMSGSGSACFALLRDTSDEQAIIASIRRNFGEPATVVVTRFL